MVESDMTATTESRTGYCDCHHRISAHDHTGCRAHLPFAPSLVCVCRKTYGCGYCHKPIIDPEYHEHGHCTDNN